MGAVVTSYRRLFVPLWDGPGKEGRLSIYYPVGWNVVGKVGEVMGMSGGSTGVV